MIGMRGGIGGHKRQYMEGKCIKESWHLCCLLGDNASDCVQAGFTVVLRRRWCIGDIC